jgi:hypothetical protein
MGTPPNTSIVLSPEEVAFIDREFDGRRSAAIHAALAALMRRGYYYPTVAVRKTRRGDWLVYEDMSGNTGRQYARFEEEAVARQYAADLRADLLRQAIAVAEMAVTPIPATAGGDPIDPRVHPAFSALRAEHGESYIAFVERVVQAVGAADRYGWGDCEEIVKEGYDSPYRFGRLLRELVDDDGAFICRHNPSGIYICLPSGPVGRAAFYDPSRRETAERPAQDWFEAAVEMSDAR